MPQHKTCHKGHPMTPGNVVVMSNGFRRCKICLDAYERPVKPPCTLDGCEEPQFCTGLCRRHYNIKRRHGDPRHGERDQSSLPGENWLPVSGLEGRYEVSDLGRVRSLPFARTPGGILAAFLTGPKPHRYLAVKIGGKSRKVHILVADHFCAGREPGLEVRHLDGDKANNAAANLCWGTSSDNKFDTVAHGNHRNARKTHCKNGHEFTPENTIIRKNGGRTCRRCARDATERYLARKAKAARQARDSQGASDSYPNPLKCPVDLQRIWVSNGHLGAQVAVAGA